MHETNCSDPDSLGQMASELYSRLVLVSGFCAFALRERDFVTLLQTACAAARDGVHTEFVGVWQYRSDTASLLLQAGIGWRREQLGQARIAVEQRTATCWSWRTSQPASAGATESGAMFRLSPLHEGSGIHQAISVAVPAETGKPFGVLEVGCRHRDEFSDIDLLYLQTIASRLGAALSRRFATFQDEDRAVRARPSRARSASKMDRVMKGVGDW